MAVVDVDSKSKSYAQIVYRLVFGFVALILLAALLPYRRAPERRAPHAAHLPQEARGIELDRPG